MNPILVFDLDETLIRSEKSYKEGKYDIKSIIFNDRLLQLIKRAIILRGKGKIDAILLLTNNTNVSSIYNGTNDTFLNIVNMRLQEDYKMNMSDVFDVIYSAERGEPRGIKSRNYNFIPFRPYGTRVYSSAWSGTAEYNYRPRKDINTIKRMLSEIHNRNISPDRLEDRIFFFDDETIPHVLKDELESHDGKYIQVTPPFGKGEDTTDLQSIETILTSLEKETKGGKRYKRNKTHKKRK